MLSLGEEVVTLGYRLLELGERLDARGETVAALGERLDRRAQELLELGTELTLTGDRIDSRGGELAERVGDVARTGADLIATIPPLEIATPLEGAIDRVGRLVDRLPGGQATRRRDAYPPEDPAPDRAGSTGQI